MWINITVDYIQINSHHGFLPHFKPAINSSEKGINFIVHKPL